MVHLVAVATGAALPARAAEPSVGREPPARKETLTAERVGALAAETSYRARAADELAVAAEARADAARTGFFPRVHVKGSYTRLSDFTLPTLGAGALVVTREPEGTQDPTPTFAGGGLRFPMVLDQWLAQATVVLPVSDYFLKVSRAYTAATQEEEAARLDAAASRAKAYADGKIACFVLLRARGAAGVAEQTLAVAKAHLRDATNQLGVGAASRADVLRAQTAVAAAELGVDRAGSAVAVAERELRVAIQAPEDTKLDVVESLESPLPPAPRELRALVHDAHASRPELKSLERNAEAARRLASAEGAGRLPSLSAFGEVVYANPSPRRIPQTDQWFPTWAAGAQVTWSLDELSAAGPRAAASRARAAALDAERRSARNGIEVEVARAYEDVNQADRAIATTSRQLESAEEGYRVARQLFNSGRGTATTLLDAETSLAAARFEHLDAKVDARVARIRLDHAIGRDVRAR